MEKEKTKVDEYEASLVAEEKTLEGIRDSLRGVSRFILLAVNAPHLKML